MSAHPLRRGKMSKKIDRIMACVDFSDYTPMVLEYAKEIAENSNAEILVYNVINQRDVNMVGAVSKYAPDKLSVEGYVEGLVKERKEMLETLKKELFMGEQPAMRLLIDVGIPSEQILKTIETEAIDLVVLANKGRGNLERVLFGSAAEKVFRHSPVPVVSVRDRKTFKKEK